VKISMIGHSTVLIEMAGLRILTDPYFGLRGNLAYSRPKPPSCKREHVIGVDLVLVSHNHFDHTDRAYFRALPATTPILAPSKTCWVTRLKGGQNVSGIAPWQQQQFRGITITAVPAWHSTITHGFILQSQGTTLYFAADTYYGKFMKRIGQDFKPDVALMPVTTYRIPLTMGESSAVAAARDLSPRVIIPIHLGIKPRSPILRTAQTPTRFAERLRQAGIASTVTQLNEGESWSAQSA
jgi:L-ascorbate metabolism protein UlaG (beta-lactamase superfamily)